MTGKISIVNNLIMDYAQNLSVALKINKKLPRLSYPLTASYDFLNISIPNGFKIDNLYNPIDMGQLDFVEYNGKKVYWGYDATALALEKTFDHPVIGDGVAFKAVGGHVSSPYCRSIWGPKSLPNAKPLIDRVGWCFTIHKSRAERDLIVDILVEEYNDLFDQPNFFVYDQINPKHKNLIPKMFRSPTDSYSGFSYSKKSGHFDTAPWHETALIELVPETRSYFFYITEKTLKPISAGMPFVIIGCHNFLRRLKHLGFQTFHPIIDESYDDEFELDARINKAVRAFGDFVKNPGSLIQLQKICHHNQQILNKLQINDYYQHTWKKMRRLLGLSTG